MKLISDRIINALSLASHLHRNHTRHDNDETPYISHLASVAMYLQCVTDDEDIVIAGIMHDSVEDVPDYTYDDLVIDCGVRVADIVLSVTENKSLPYKEMKLDYINKVKSHGIETLLISLADKLHNAKSLKTMPPDKIHKGHLWLYEEILVVAKEKMQDIESINTVKVTSDMKSHHVGLLLLINELEHVIKDLKSFKLLQ